MLQKKQNLTILKLPSEMEDISFVQSKNNNILPGIFYIGDAPYFSLFPFDILFLGVCLKAVFRNKRKKVHLS